MRIVLPLVLALGVLAGCAGPMRAWDIAPGTPRDAVVARAGQPSRVVPLPEGGQRLQYTTQPMGHYAFMVDLDAAGRVLRSRQVMSAQEFHRIEPGTWTRADVEREFGPPAFVDGVGNFQGGVMTYRWKEVNEPMFYFVYVDPQGIVRRAHPGIEFINAPNDKN